MFKINKKIKKIKYSQIGKSSDDEFISFIYKKFMNEYYRIFSLDENNIINLLKYKNFNGMNVFYPYTKFIIDKLENMTDQAKEIGEINLVQEYNNRLFGFNTKYFGIMKFLEKFNIKIENKNVLILAEEKPIDTILYLLKIFKINSYEVLNFEEFKSKKDSNAQIIFSTIDFEKYDDSIINLDNYKKLETVIDLNASPIFSKLYISAINKNIKAYNGLYALLYQEKKNIEILTKQRFDDTVFEDILREYIKSKLNIILVGMPGAGKTTIGKKVSNILNKEHIDLDIEFYYEYGISPSQYLKNESEESFRDKESKIVERLSHLNNKIISTSGGAVQLIENHYHLKKNSIIFRVDRNIEDLSTRNRPLSNGGIKTLIKMLNSRKKMYEYFADFIVENRGNFDKTAIIIVDIYKKYIKKEL